MKRIKAEFARRRELAWWLPAGLCAALVLTAVDQAQLAWAAQQRTAITESEIARLSTQVDTATQAQRGLLADLSKPPTYQSDALAVAKLANFPLDQVFTAIESTQVQGVKITAMELTAQDGEARVNLEYTDYPLLLHYLEEINAGEPTPRWNLLQAHITQNTATPNSGVLISRWSSARQ